MSFKQVKAGREAASQPTSVQACNSVVFVQSKIDTHRVPFLVDTGSDVTMISTLVYNALGRNRQELEPPLVRYRAANGEALDVLGFCSLTIGIGNGSYNQRVLVADMAESAILGVDFLYDKKAVVDVFSNTLRIGDEYVKLTRDNQSVRSCRVIATQDFVIPPESDSILGGFVKQRGVPLSEGIVEPLKGHLRSGPIILGKALVKCNEGRVPVRVLNCGKEPLTVFKGTNLGLMCPVQCCVTDVGSSSDKDDSEVDELLAELIKETRGAVSKDQGDIVEKFLLRNQKVFMKSDKKLGKCIQYLHDIDTGDAHPIRQRAYRLPVFKREEVDRQVREMLDQGIVTPSASPWASPIVLVLKKDGTLRFCIDFRKLNGVTKKDAYPLPRIDDSIDTLSGSQYFTTLDLASGYWQLGLTDRAMEKTAFTTGTGLYQFKVMPFGLSNAPSSFERLMERVLVGLNWKICLIYLDDIIIFSSTFEEHLQRLQKVLDCIANAGLKLKPQKCHLFRTEVLYLGFLVGREGVRTDPEKVRKVREWAPPQTVTEVRSFLGFCAYYRKFVRDFSCIGAPLFALTKKHQKFHWDEHCQRAFDKLKIALQQDVVLAYPDFSKEFILDTDASDISSGAVLSQIIDEEERVVAYFSATHSPAERKYSVTRKELLAVVKAVKHFYPYLYGREFTIRTDHASLRWLTTFKQPQGQVARWIEFLDGFQAKIVHRPGSKHTNADALSRLPLTCASIAFDNLGWSDAEISQAQGEDPVLGPIWKCFKEGQGRPSYQAMDGAASRAYWVQWDQLEMRSDILYRNWFHEKEGGVRKLVLVPQKFVKEVLELAHDSPVGGHLGVNKTLFKVRQTGYWVGMKRDVASWLRTCKECEGRKNPVPTRTAPMVTMHAGEPLARVAVDIMCGLPLTERGNKCILVVGDYFSKWMEAYPMPNQEAVTVARILVYKFFSRFGIPRELHSDRGANFESGLMREVCRLLGIAKTRTTAYHPQCDGLVERANRTIENMLSAYVADNQGDWDIHLPLITMAYRCSVHETTKFTPNKLMLGKETNVPLTLMVGSPPNSPLSPVDYVADLESRVKQAYELVEQHVKGQQLRQKAGYDKRVHGGGFAQGDKVWLFTPLRRRGLSRKLYKHWDGPYLILLKLSDVNYVVQKDGRGNKQVVHFNRIKPYWDRDELDIELAGLEGAVGGTDITNTELDDPVQVSDPLEWDDPVQLDSPDGLDDLLEADQVVELEGDLDLGGAELDTSLLPSTRGRRRKPPNWMLSGQYDLT